MQIGYLRYIGDDKIRPYTEIELKCIFIKMNKVVIKEQRPTLHCYAYMKEVLQNISQHIVGYEGSLQHS
jgi:hypothetical protein